MNWQTNPVVFRELIRHLRSPRAFRSLFLVLSITGLIFCFNYYVGMRSWTIDHRDGRTIFFPLIYILCLFGFPLSALASAGIVHEREADTLDLLLTSPLRRLSILWGKCAANLVYALLFAAAILPFLSICFLIGGISINDMAQCFSAIFGFYVLAVMMGVFVSLFSVSTASASRVSIGLLILLILGPYAFRYIWEILKIMLAKSTAQDWSGFGLELAINPFAAIVLVNVPMSISSVVPGGGKSRSYILKFFADNPGVVSGFVNLLLALILFLITAYLFHLLGPLLSARFNWNIFPRRNQSSQNAKNATIEDSIQPFFDALGKAAYQKETLFYNRKLLTQDRTLIIAMAIISFLIAWVFWAATGGGHDVNDFMHVRVVIASLSAAITCFFSHIAPSHSITVEKRRETWPLLRTTTIPSISIIRGKVFGHFKQSVYPILALFIFYYLANFFFALWHNRWPNRYYLTDLFFLLSFYLCCIYFYTCLGIMFSSLSRDDGISPSRKTFGTVMLHAIIPYLVTAAIMMTAVVFNPFQTMNIKEHPWLNAIYNYLYFFSPLSLPAPIEWNGIHYAILFVHSIALIVLGTIFMWGACGYIKKRE
ncbi:MAG: ABC transporter permease subunit [Candidatus Omnitrophota bacterium]